jgi:nucleotide-binding universal stress UspA family protein
MATKQVVVGYDGSESSRVALTWAMQAARGRKLPVLIAHAGYSSAGAVAGFMPSVEPSPEALHVAAQAMITAAVHEARREVPGVEVSTTVVPGPAVQVLLEVMDGAELGVVGSRGRGSFHELLIGSTSLQLAAHVSCPLVVVRSMEYVDPGPEAGRVVVGVDGSQVASAAVAFAFEEASLRGCGLTAVHAWQVPAFDAYGWGPVPTDPAVLDLYEQEAMRVLAESMAGWAEKYPDIDLRQSLVRDGAVAALVKASKGAEVVVVGSRGLGGFGSLLLGSVSHAVLHHAHSAVALIRPRAD